MKKGVIALTVILACAAIAGAVPMEGDRILIDVGICWERQTPTDGSAPDGNFWNNSGGWRGTVALNRASDGAATGASFSLSTVATAVACGGGAGQVSGNAPLSTLYPETAQSSLRWFDGTVQPGYVYLTGMGSLPCNVGVYGYLSDGVAHDEDENAILTPATAIYEVVAGTCAAPGPITVDVVNNDSVIAWFRGVVPDAQGNITVQVTGGTGDFLAAPVNVVDITVVPEPATLAMLGIGGVLALVRRRR